MLICPSCGDRSHDQETPYGLRSSCYRCGLWSWGGKPLVDAETHEARKQAHAEFDKIWQEKLVSRNKAYKLLQKELGLSPDECHISLMDKHTAQLVPSATKIIRAKLEG